MSLVFLDFIFPFFVLGYGALITIVLNLPVLEKLSQEKLNYHMHNQLQLHRGIALVCLVVGAIWSLQNIWSRNNPLF